MADTEAFKQWAFSLIISGIAGTLVSLLSPRGNMEKALRTVIGIFIVSALCSPLVTLGSNAELPSFSIEENAMVQADELGKQMEESCRKTIGIAAKEVATELGITEYNVNADLYIDDKFCIIIQEICVVLPTKYKEFADDFSQKLQTRLGVPVTAECK